MDKKTIIIIVAVILLGAAFWALQSGFFFKNENPVSSPEGVILFYGEGCPHCKNVEDFLVQNNIKDKVEFTELEVYHNEANQKILLEKVNACGVDTSNVGIPFLWDGENCIIGDQDIINFFSQYK